MTLLAGLDVGTSSVKGLLVSADDGAVLARAEVAASAVARRARAGPSRIPGTGGPAPRPCSRSSAAPARSAAIGLTGQMHGLVALDAAGGVLRPAMLWNDGRTAAECAEIEQTRRPRAR